jgi:adenylate cyclase class 2
MSTEIEAKMKIEDFAPLRKKLQSLGASRLHTELETNNFFDTPDKHLQKEDRGLRIRIAINQETNESHCTVTMKGPLQKGLFKEREELEFTASDPAPVRAIFENLGYHLTLSFEKRRESWTFADCSVVLDELPYLGTYVEIEGKTESAVASARTALGLENLPNISSGYISLLSRYLSEHNISERHIRL